MGDRQQNSPNQQLPSIHEELWLMAEERAQEILCTIQPNVISEVNRKQVIEYVQRLITGYYGSEVFPFGSVPLKTYLPDGDIDLTALSHENADEELAQTVCSLLESSDDSEFQVKDVQYIRAQVQVVKCTVKNIAVDISFNQMAGLYALHFLEQVDQLVGENHLFKRSIILIKAWCYYESRILGAHHGLLSTYAVETLVLYIINSYHSSLRGPLEVLYRFLDFYSTFDWESNYVSIDGPKALSSLPEIVETPECERVGLLLSTDFLRNYRDMCSITTKATETTSHEFPTKHLNILDPLRNNNNLGRSVSRGNLHRIRFALSFGARKLKEILTLPGERMGVALEKFFMNTLDRNGKGQRPDVDIPVPAFGTGRAEESVLCGDCESYYGALQYVQLSRRFAMPLPALSSSPSSAAQLDTRSIPTQQNWSMFYQAGTNVYVPIQPDVYVTTKTDVYAPTQTDVYVPTRVFYHPNASQATYSIEDIGKSRGTGTYIPDMTHNSYSDARVKMNRPRRYVHVNHHHVFPKSPQKRELDEVHSGETPDTNGNARSFELAKEEFPGLPTICSNEVRSDMKTYMTGNARSFELAREGFPLFPTTSQNEVHSDETNYMSCNARSFELAKEEFPLLPTIRQKEVHTIETTDMNGSAKLFELPSEEFPLLPLIRQNSTPEARKSVPSGLTPRQGRHSSMSQLNVVFGSYSGPATGSHLPTKDEKENSGISSTEGTTTVVQGATVAMEKKDESHGSEEKRAESLTINLSSIAQLCYLLQVVL